MRYIIGIWLILWLSSCEKEIQVSVPGSKQQYVVEASVNTYSPMLNYVFVSTTLDYFKPDLTMNGISDANVYITKAAIQGSDTTYPTSNRVAFVDLSKLGVLPPQYDSLLKKMSGIYMNPLFIGEEKTCYLLEIELKSGEKVSGKTCIPAIVPIDSSYIRKDETRKDSTKNMYLSFWFTDSKDQDNYRMAVRNYPDSNLLGWGSAQFFSTFDDRYVNNVQRPVQFLNPWDEGDTIQIYFNHIGRKEFLFWESYGKAANNGGPFATPGNVSSNIVGAIGSFTGYATTHKQYILEKK